MIVRRAEAQDLAGVMALYRQLLPEDPILPPDRAETVWSDLLTSDRTMVIVAEDDGVIASTCVLVIVPNLTRDARPFALIENVVTDARLRRKGGGTAVLRYAIDCAWSARCYKVMLSTGRTDAATLRFYEAAGFIRGGKTFFECRNP